MNKARKHNRNITLENKPPWYRQYDWSPVPDNTSYFVGREIEFFGFWYQMANLVGSGKHQKSNYAFIGQRKIGKTAYLKRCYNIAFWEQDEVVPFYYSFSQNDGCDQRRVIQMASLKQTMPIEFLQQFFAYYTKNRVFLSCSSVERIVETVAKTEMLHKELLLTSVETCLDQIEKAQDTFMLQNIWELTQHLSLVVGKNVC